MWVFVSSRLRMWLLMAVALPLARFLVHQIARAAHQRRPDATTTRLLDNADSAMTSVSERARRYRRG
jgi:hypothetical protein